MRKIGMLMILGAMLAACSSQPSGENNAFSQPVIPVFAEEVKEKDVPLYIESLGILKPAIWVEVRPQVSGMLQAVRFTEGQMVKQGDILFVIDSQPYAIKLEEAEAHLAHDKVALDLSHKKMERYQSLFKKDLIPQQEWDEMHSEIARNEAQVKNDETRVAAATLDLQHCTMTAPIAGKTGKAFIHPGNLVSPGQEFPLTTVSNMNEMVVEFTLTENEFQQLTPEHQAGKHPIEVASFSHPEKISHGVLTFLDNMFDAKTGLLLLQGRFSNDSYLPGQHVRVKIPINMLKASLVVPQKAVKINQTGPYVFSIKTDNSVEIRQIKLGEEFEDKVIVTEGLAAGEKVITDGHLRLAPGSKVEIKQGSL